MTDIQLTPEQQKLVQAITAALEPLSMQIGGMTPTEALQNQTSLSVAISLKRIADVLTRPPLMQVKENGDVEIFPSTAISTKAPI